MAFDPDVVYISPSSIADFEKCPQLYYLRNVFRTVRGLKLQQISPALALGQTVHDAIDRLVKLEPSERSQNRLLEEFEWSWQAVTGLKGGFVVSEVEPEYKQRGSEMLNRFWENRHFHTAIGAKIPNFPKVDLGEKLILTGKLDWVEQDGDSYHIIDFKTGKNEQRSDSVQLPTYALMVHEIFNTTNIKASYWYLDKTSEMQSVELPDLKQSKILLSQKGEIIKLARSTNSMRCQSGGQSCYACADMLAISKGVGKLVSIDPARKQEIYILIKNNETPSQELPF